MGEKQENDEKDINFDTNLSIFDGGIQRTYIVNGNHYYNVNNRNNDNSSDTNNLRVILPAFIQNEQLHSQTMERRIIHSSPVKSSRRFSQDSQIIGRQLNVSRDRILKIKCDVPNSKSQLW